MRKLFRFQENNHFATGSFGELLDFISKEPEANLNSPKWKKTPSLREKQRGGQNTFKDCGQALRACLVFRFWSENSDPRSGRRQVFGLA